MLRCEESQGDKERILGECSTLDSAVELSVSIMKPIYMKPEHKFHSYVTAATVTVMYFAIQQLPPLLRPESPLATFLEPIGALLLSVGIYKLLAGILLGFARKLKFVKRHLLGASYVNGTWIGKFKGSDSSIVYTVEHFEQTLSSLKIRGQAFRESGESYAQWTSESETIDEVSGMLTYTYNCDKTNDKGSFQGVCVFQFERKDETCGPMRIRGYSADLVDGNRTENRETKISEDLLPFDEAILAAQKA